MLTKGQILNALNCLNNELADLDMTSELLLTGGGVNNNSGWKISIAGLYRQVSTDCEQSTIIMLFFVYIQ